MQRRGCLAMSFMVSGVHEATLLYFHQAPSLACICCPAVHAESYLLHFWSNVLPVLGAGYSCA